MAMSVGPSGGPRSDINITPLVDVVLVLLIIFMVITPLIQMGYPVQVPPKVESAQPPPSSDQLIVRMDDKGTTFINKVSVPLPEFPGKLKEALTGRSSKVIFFAADGDLEYGRVADFMDMCRDAGAENLGIVFDDLDGPGAAATAVGAT
ncbi:MAG TPA: biopolymer transporter ExbD [Thermoanaerobaculia bacterium]|jgi:biopolymer transport protein ExbD|nr:biopolymer transporter ExbD [Thermoanaerobaculia bacterium]